MSSKRRKINISLIALSLILGAWAAVITLQPMSGSIPVPEKEMATDLPAPISAPAPVPEHGNDTTRTEQAFPTETIPPATGNRRSLTETSFRETDISSLANYNPFRAEALKVMGGQLEETDSASRHRILSYCEHLRTSYNTRDIDFIRQVFSDNALIIVGHTVRTGHKDATGTGSRKVIYGIRSKKEYLERLERIFRTNSKIDVEFSDFRLLRHPTVEGIYGVTLRQKYRSDSYSDDGFLFLLWDFRDPHMPLIHVRTWQPSPDILSGNEEVIELGDFNLE